MSNIVFDKFHKGYDDWYDTKIGKFVDDLETDKLFELLDLKRGMKILDLGCGTGNISFKLSALGCDVTGIDISKKMLEEANKKNIDKKIKFVEMSGDKIEFPDNEFDVVVSMAAFEFIHSPKEVYKEMKRVTKQEGAIVIGTIQKNGSWEKLYSSDICKDTAYELARFKTKDDLIGLDEKNIDAIKETLYTPPGLKEKEYTYETEKIYKEENNVGGFVCVKYLKKK